MYVERPPAPAGRLLASNGALYGTLVLDLRPEPFEETSAQRPAPEGGWLLAAVREKDHGTTTIQEKQISHGAGPGVFRVKASER